MTMIGEVLGSYRIVSRLGSGGMGTVWLAQHKLLGSRAAIKLLKPEMSAQKEIVQRFFDEARAATRIHDPGIVMVLDFGWHKASAYIVMEHLQGEALSTRLVRLGTLPTASALRIVQQSALAMAAAHARGIIHRDLKPDNIFLVHDPAMPGGERAKILDFGIAKLIDDPDPNHSRTHSDIILGTPAFMSPEQCRGAGRVDHRTDIYSLGCVLFNLVVGHPPFVAPSGGEAIAAHLTQPPPVPSTLRSELAPALDALILRCLDKVADARYQTMTELVRAIAAITGENLSVETLPPFQKRTPTGTEPTEQATMATNAPVATTLGASSGQAFVRARSWRVGIVAGALALSTVGGVVSFFVVRDQTASAPEPDAAKLPLTVPADAPETDAIVDALVAVEPDAAPDAAPASSRLPTKPPPKRTPPVTNAPGSGSAGSAAEPEPGFETR